MFFTSIWIAPERDFAIIIASNIGSTVASKPCDVLASELIKRYL